jgi:hypothetical protein
MMKYDFHGPIVWQACEPCDCGDSVRHHDGGHYHDVIEIREVAPGLYLGVLSDTREVFPADEHHVCPTCGFSWWKDSTTHVCPVAWDDPRLVELRAVADEWGSL